MADNDDDDDESDSFSKNGKTKRVREDPEYADSSSNKEIATKKQKLRFLSRENEAGDLQDLPSPFSTPDWPVPQTISPVPSRTHRSIFFYAMPPRERRIQNLARVYARGSYFRRGEQHPLLPPSSTVVVDRERGIVTSSNVNVPPVFRQNTRAFTVCPRWNADHYTEAAKLFLGIPTVEQSFEIYVASNDPRMTACTFYSPDLLRSTEKFKEIFATHVADDGPSTPWAHIIEGTSVKVWGASKPILYHGTLGSNAADAPGLDQRKLLQDNNTAIVIKGIPVYSCEPSKLMQMRSANGGIELMMSVDTRSDIEKVSYLFPLTANQVVIHHLAIQPLLTGYTYVATPHFPVLLDWFLACKLVKVSKTSSTGQPDFEFDYTQVYQYIIMEAATSGLEFLQPSNVKFLPKLVEFYYSSPKRNRLRQTPAQIKQMLLKRLAMSIMVQVLFSLYAAFKLRRFAHGDIHLGNVLWRLVTATSSSPYFNRAWVYQMDDGRKFVLPVSYHMHIFIEIIDFDRSMWLPSVNSREVSPVMNYYSGRPASEQGLLDAHRDDVARFHKELSKLFDGFLQAEEPVTTPTIVPPSPDKVEFKKTRLFPYIRKNMSAADVLRGPTFDKVEFTRIYPRVSEISMLDPKDAIVVGQVSPEDIMIDL